MESLSKLEHMKPSLLYPGHGPVVTNGVAKIQQYISHRMERERQVSEDIHPNNQLHFLPVQIAVS